MAEYESLLPDALELSKTFDVYPLAPFTNVPSKGSHGELDATKDHETIFSWFEAQPLISLGLYLKNTNVLAIDVDDHANDGAGIQELMQLSNGNSLEGATVVKTPSGQGLHLYFRFPDHLTIEDSRLTKNIEVLRTKVTAPASRKKLKDGSIGEYVLSGSSSLNDLNMIPTWLLDVIMSNQQGKQSNNPITLNFNNSRGSKKYTAILLEEIVQGVEESERNVWLTRITGKLLALGMNPTECYQFILVINESFIEPKLSDKEVNTIFKSILKREAKKRGVVN